MIGIALDSGDKSFPKCKPTGKCLAAWNDRIKPLRDDALFWHSIWLDCGRSPAGSPSMIMRNTRVRYQRAVRDLKRNQAELRKTKLDDRAASADNKEFWAEVRKLNRPKPTMPTQVDGRNNDVDIAQHLADKYRNLFDSVKSDDDIMTKIQDDINACVTDEAFSDVTYTVNDIIAAVGNLNSQKYDGYKGTYSDHFVYASHRYLVVLSMLMNGMLVHGYNADDLLKSNLVSISKDVRGSLSNSDNYRGIALCSAICKIVDYAIIYKYGSGLHTLSLQFAYKQDHSTIMCTSIFQDVVNYYNHNGSNVYACLVDASKAFDRINYS